MSLPSIWLLKRAYHHPHKILHLVIDLRGSGRGVRSNAKDAKPHLATSPTSSKGWVGSGVHADGPSLYLVQMHRVPQGRLQDTRRD